MFDLTIIGFGVIGAETLYALKKKFSNHKNKNIIKIAVVERNTNNIPGGIAYSKLNSKFGFFNNPLRLSHPEFIKWFNQKKNKEKIINFSKKNISFNLIDWAKQNEIILNTRYENYKEIYLPRLSYAFYLEEKIITFLKFKKKINISVKFLQGKVNDISKKNDYLVSSDKNFIEIYPIYKKNKLTFKKKHYLKINKIRSRNIIIGIGLVPPKKIKVITKSNNTNYIFDFYNSGGVNNLVKKIIKVSNIKPKIKLTFIGNKAGLLEAVQQIEKLINVNKININILSISNNSLSLQKAEHSQKFNHFQFKFFTKQNLKKIKTAKNILIFLKKEFIEAKKNGFNKYDVWTNVLKNNFLKLAYDRLNYNEKKKYNDLIFPLIRNITRYTYPETVKSKNRLLKNKKMVILKDRVIEIVKKNDHIVLKTLLNKKIISDIVINVSGPRSILENENDTKIISSLKKFAKNYNALGFSTKNNFILDDGIYLPGTLCNKFNPARETIIKAITKNTYSVVKKLMI